MTHFSSDSSPAGTPPWAQSVDDVVRDLVPGADERALSNGLTEDEARQRLARHGENRLKARQRQSALSLFIEQFKNLIVGILALAAAVSYGFGNHLEGTAVAVAIGLNILIGFFTEWNAVRSMEALNKLGQTVAKVLRDGSLAEVPARLLVPGDVVVLEAGDLLPADIRLFEAAKLSVDEAALTGESEAVAKQTEPLIAQATLAERRNMAYRGTAVVAGSGKGVVTATGMETELGRISELAQSAESFQAPIEKRLAVLGKRLVQLTLGIVVAMAVLGVVQGRDLVAILKTAVALAVAAVPEGLPVVATIALARSMLRMARKNALVKRLSAMETLGSASILLTDKTGTLTENRMHLRRLALPVAASETGELTFRRFELKREGAKLTVRADGQAVELDEAARNALRIGVLCTNAQLDEDETTTGQGVGDPMEIALLEAGEAAGLTSAELLAEAPEVREEAFDQETKMMATFHRAEEGVLVAVKGAPERVPEVCSRILLEDGAETRPMTENDREAVARLADELAEEGTRVIALARKEVASEDVAPYEGLVFLGLAGLQDPPREGVREVVARMSEAGIRVVMATGDHPATARAIAREVGLGQDGVVGVRSGTDLGDLTSSPDKDAAPTPPESDESGLLEVNVFARVTPEQKLRLIDLYQAGGQTTAMTGDGVNDAPALKKADIGVAMGKRGTQVAREAAEMVLMDDRLESVLAAVEEGRAIFANIRKFLVFLLSGNLGEILIVALALALSLPLPITPLQILYLNMLGDVFPALALGLGPGHPSQMRRPPRSPEEPLMTRALWLGTCGYALVIGAVVFLAFAACLYHWPLAAFFGVGPMEVEGAVSTAFLTLTLARLFHVFNMRDTASPLVINEITRNPYVWGALALCTALLGAAVYVEVLARALGVTPPTNGEAAFILTMSFAPLFLCQASRAVWTILSRRLTR